jgi:hypothetical protein
MRGNGPPLVTYMRQSRNCGKRSNVRERGSCALPRVSTRQRATRS